MGGSGASAEGGGGMGMSAGGNGGHANDPCAGLPTQNVIYVHGLDGDDAAGTGACEKPFKTIKKAHSVAASLGTATTIHLAGALPPIVYSAQTNGEDAEIQLMAPGLDARRRRNGQNDHFRRWPLCPDFDNVELCSSLDGPFVTHSECSFDEHAGRHVALDRAAASA